MSLGESSAQRARRLRRRRLLTVGSAAATGLGAAALWQWWPFAGIRQPCADPRLPAELAEHPVVRAAYAGIDPASLWDCHVHLLGLGKDAATADGTWINPVMQSATRPLQYAQYRFYLNAGCIDPDSPQPEAAYVERMLALQRAFAGGRARLMLMAFTLRHDDEGRPQPELSAFQTSDGYAASVARAHPDAFEWIASIHPYRPDAVDALQRAAADGARGVKWLPPVMNIDPASAKCEAFYRALATLDLPLITHGGEEKAVSLGPNQELGNPLRLRRALDAGVRVFVAHCASLGESLDADQGANARPASNFALFTRLMDDARYRGRLFGELSAVTIFTRPRNVMSTLIERSDWHERLCNGSDYPLPAVVPIISTRRFVDWGMLDADAAPVLDRLRLINPLLFDLALKRALHLNGKRLSAQVFDTRRHFVKSA
jgi:uncharacterized protein